MNDRTKLLLECFRSGQMTIAQALSHFAEDPAFAEAFDRKYPDMTIEQTKYLRPLNRIERAALRVLLNCPPPISGRMGEVLKELAAAFNESGVDLDSEMLLEAYRAPDNAALQS